MAATTDRPTVHHPRWTAGPGNLVLDSKITFPALPSWTVPRERIKAIIAKGARGPLTVVTGPPGAGKSMALASWAAQSPGPVAWVSLDTFDNRPATFWSYLTEALRRAGLPVSPDLPALATKRADRFLHKVALTMAGQQPAATLVLDDFHLLTEQSVLDGLGYLLRNAGNGLHLLLASRTEAMLPVHRYRLTGELTEVTAAALAFTAPEAGQLMAQHGIVLTPDALLTMTRRCEGWPAGLRLAALSLAGHPEPEQGIRDLAAENSAIARYFVEEVLNIQPAPVRDLLIKTSIVDRISVGLASELAGAGKAGQAIPALAQANAFVQPAGNGWYRYHSLFADVLRHKLRHELPDKEAQLHRRAAVWLRRHGALPEAVGQAVAAGDRHLAARMTVDELAIGTLLDPRGGEPLAAVLRYLPPGPPPQDPPSLVLASVLALRAGQDSECLACLTAAERLLGQLPDDAEIPSRMAAASIRMTLATRCGDVDMLMTAAVQSGRALSSLPTDLLARHPEARARELSRRGIAELWAGRFDAAAATLGDCAAGPCRCAGSRAVAELLAGRLSEAGRLAAAAGDPAGGPDARDSRAAAEVVLAWVHLERHQIAEAADRLARMKGALRAQPDRLLNALASLAAARLNLARGRPDVTAAIVDRARAGWAPPPWLAQRMALTEAYARAVAGDADGALHAAGRAGPPTSLPGALALAQVRLIVNGPEAAARALASGARPPGAAAEPAPDYLRLEAWLLQAELFYRGGQAARGRNALEQALKHAGKERVLLPFVVRKGWIVPVLGHDARLADAFRTLFPSAGNLACRPANRLPALADDTPPVATEPLSGRELEVLQHVSKMLSTEEIAQEMHLSADTIKSHLKSIFRKLGVSRRREAVRRAEQLALM